MSDYRAAICMVKLSLSIIELFYYKDDNDPNIEDNDNDHGLTVLLMITIYNKENNDD